MTHPTTPDQPIADVLARVDSAIKTVDDYNGPHVVLFMNDAKALLTAYRSQSTAPSGQGLDEHAAFQAWAIPNWPNSRPPENAWQGWQARAALASQPSTAPLCQGSPGFCARNGACMYHCGRTQPPSIAQTKIPFAGFDPKFCPGSNPENPQEFPEQQPSTAPAASEGQVPYEVWVERVACARVADAFAHDEGPGERCYSGNVISARILGRTKGRAAPAPAAQAEPEGKTFWLWRNGDHFLAFEHLYPCYSPGGDPMTLGEPFGRAVFRKSFDRSSKS